MKNRDKKILLWLVVFILVLGAALRGIYFFEFAETPFARHPRMDERYYHRLAQEVSKGDLLRPRAFFMGPLYPYTMGVFYFLFGARPEIIRLWQMALGLLNIFLIYLLGRRVFNQWTGLLSAFFLAIFRTQIFYEQTLLMEVLKQTLILLCFHLLCSAYIRLKPTNRRTDEPTNRYRTKWLLLLSGWFLGLAALCRGNVLLFLPFFWLWCFASLSSAIRYLAILLFTAGTVLCILPATIHNYLSEKEFIPITSNFGINFYIGNNPKSKGRFLLPDELDMEYDPGGEWVAGRALGKKKFSSKELDYYWRRKAMELIRQQPVEFLKLLARKFYNFWGRLELSQIHHLNFIGELTPLMRLPLMSYSLLIPLALIGLGLVLPKREPFSILLALFILAYCLSLIPFFVTARYRIPAIPLMALFGAYYLCSLRELIKEGQYLKTGVLIFIAVALFFLLDNRSPSFLKAEEATYRNALGLLYRQEGKTKDAIVEFKKGLELKPSAQMLTNLGNIYLEELQKYEPAISLYKFALQMQPNLARTHFNLAQAYLHKGEQDNARKHFERGLELAPDLFPLAHFNLAQIYYQKKALNLAIQHLQRFVELEPKEAAAFNLLIKYLLEADKATAAITIIQQKMQETGEAPALWYNLGVCYQHLRKYDEARRAYLKAIELDPSFPPAVEALKQIGNKKSD